MSGKWYAECDPKKPFGASTLVASIDTTGIDLSGHLAANETLEEYPSWVSADACVLWFSSDRTTGGRNNNGDIYFVQRPL